MKKTVRSRFTALLSLSLVFALLFGLCGCSFFSEDEPETTVINVKTPLPTDVTSSIDENSNVVTGTDYSPEALAANTKTIFEYFNLHLNELKGETASVSMRQGKSIGKATDENGESIPMSDNEYVNVAISTLSDLMVDESSDSIEYGGDIKAFLPVKGEDFVSRLTLDDIESATCADNGTERQVTVTLKSPALPATLEKAYDMNSVDDIMAEFEKANAYMTAEKPVITYKDCRIIITADIETDEVIRVEYIKTADVKTSVTGEGKLESIGTVPVIFNYSSSVTYSIDRTNPEDETLAER